MNFTDPWGLKDQWFGFNDPNFRDWVHGEKPKAGRRAAQNYTKQELTEFNKQWTEDGKPRGKGGKSGRGGKYKNSLKNLLKKLKIPFPIFIDPNAFCAIDPTLEWCGCKPGA